MSRGLCWLLLRARDEDGKWRFLLQQRPDGSWGMPGGKPHLGEDPWAAALRETEEEIGKFPPPYDCAGTFHHVEDDGKTQVYLYLCTVPYFHPPLDGSHPGGNARRGMVPPQGDQRPGPDPEVPGGLGERHHPAGSRHQGPPADRERDRRNLRPHGSLTAPPGGR